MPDPEIEAIAQCHELFVGLTDDSKIRVIQWLISKFQLNPQSTNWTKNHTQPPTNGSDAVKILPATNFENESINGGSVPGVTPIEKSLESYNTIAEFFSDAAPNVDWEKALVVATFLQVKNDLSDFTGYEVNKELKNLGYASSNITDAFHASIDRKPQFILQLRKDGNSQQARKKYKVSNEGIKYVKALLLKSANEN